MGLDEIGGQSLVAHRTGRETPTAVTSDDLKPGIALQSLRGRPPAGAISPLTTFDFPPSAR